MAAVKAAAPIGPRLADQGGGGDGADGAEGGDGVGGAAGDVEFLLGADDQVEEVEGGLQLGGDGGALDEALLAEAVAGEAPEVGAVVDVEGGAGAVLPREAEGLQHGGLGAGVGEVGAGDGDRAGVGDQGLVDVGLAEGHVGAVLAVEDQREMGLVADAEDDEGGEALGVGDDAAGVDAFGGEGLADEAAHVLVADAGDQAGAQAEAGGAAGDVGGGAADVLVEARHVLEPAADLGAVEIDRRAADGDDVECRHAPVSSPLRAFRAARAAAGAGRAAADAALSPRAAAVCPVLVAGCGGSGKGAGAGGGPVERGVCPRVILWQVVDIAGSEGAVLTVCQRFRPGRSGCGQGRREQRRAAPDASRARRPDLGAGRAVPYLGPPVKRLRRVRRCPRSVCVDCYSQLFGVDEFVDIGCVHGC